jgi:hypothetical protein
MAYEFSRFKTSFGGTRNVTDKCKWCGAHLWDYGDVGPLHGKDGRSVSACELIQLRKLLDEVVAGSFPSEPGTAASINMRDWLSRAKAIRLLGREHTGE